VLAAEEHLEGVAGGEVHAGGQMAEASAQNGLGLGGAGDFRVAAAGVASVFSREYQRNRAALRVGSRIPGPPKAFFNRVAPRVNPAVDRQARQGDAGPAGGWLQVACSIDETGGVFPPPGVFQDPGLGVQ
jgi:hypothetical protein